MNFYKQYFLKSLEYEIQKIYNDGFQQKDSLSRFKIDIYKFSENRFIFKITLVFYFQRFSFFLIITKVQMYKPPRIFIKKKRITQKLQQNFMKKEHDKILE
ncbi:unnamed protein product [Paramecium pentaurelia]|uniref:Uncharacterized protein n=1 Tax=Paramecium pentaurelia TaxID=43138 RepID=A0A8S1YMP1_9CILI|nr:unnamed protein product [Paramecium pentaurelia]